MRIVYAMLQRFPNIQLPEDTLPRGLLTCSLAQRLEICNPVLDTLRCFYPLLFSNLSFKLSLPKFRVIPMFNTDILFPFYCSSTRLPIGVYYKTSSALRRSLPLFRCVRPLSATLCNPQCGDATIRVRQQNVASRFCQTFFKRWWVWWAGTMQTTDEHHLSALSPVITIEWSPIRVESAYELMAIHDSLRFPV